MLVDVLIIGAGPHALTLASLLSGPDPHPDPPGSCSESPRPQRPTSVQPDDSGERKMMKRRRRRRRRSPTTTGQTHELQGDPSTPSTPEGGAVLPPLTLQVVDSYGEWTSLWESQFRGLGISHLRSHTLVHTEPLDKGALQTFVVDSNRSSEVRFLSDRLFILDENTFFSDARLGKKEKKRLNVSTSLKKSLSFSLPGTSLSVDFFRHQVEKYHLDQVLVKGTVERIVPVVDLDPGDSTKKKKRVNHFEVRLQDGSMLRALRVVVATGPTRAHMANIPAWARGVTEAFPEERLQHTVQLMHRLSRSKLDQGEAGPPEGLSVVCDKGQRVMVVGGGLTSAHVVSLALQHGAAHVTWVMRKHLQLKQFDVGDVESLVGRYDHVEHGIKMDGRAYLRQFYNERSLHRRSAMIRQARKGGAVTPEAYVHLQPFIRGGQVEVRTYCQVSEANWCYRTQAWSLTLSTGHHWTGDRIWLATGCKLDVGQDPLLREVMEEFPVAVMDGWPCISESLRWTDGCPLYLMGQYTALQVGPHAVNLAGGQAAARRIADDIRRRGQHGKQVSPEPKSKTEEFIQHMHGLMWL